MRQFLPRTVRHVRTGRGQRRPRRGGHRAPHRPQPGRRRRPHRRPRPDRPGPARLPLPAEPRRRHGHRHRGQRRPVAVDWTWSGHDGGISEDHRIEERVTRWFDRYLKDDPAADTGPAFRVTRISGIDTTNGDTLLRGAEAAAYPGLGGDPRKIGLTGSAQDIANPAGGTPPSISAVPGLGSLSGLSTLGMGLALDFPGQFASFDSAPLAETVRVTGSPAIRLHIASDAPEAVLFLKVYDVSPDGSSQSLPAQLVTPVRVTGTDGEGTTAELPLPAIDYPFEAGHRMRLVVSTTDLGYASPPEPATHTVTLADDDAALTVPTAPQAAQLPTPLPWWTWALPVAAAALAALLLLTGRHRPTRRTPAPDPQDPQGPQDPQAPSTGTVPVPAQDPGPHGGPPADPAVPLHITGLTKRYAGSVDRYAVRDLGFSVERGQVLGLLGPNGAGKTTTLRMLMGLITPDAGEIRVFGQRITPAPPSSPGSAPSSRAPASSRTCPAAPTWSCTGAPPAAPPPTRTWTRPWRSPASATPSPARCAPTRRACGSASPSPRPCSACPTC